MFSVVIHKNTGYGCFKSKDFDNGLNDPYLEILFVY